MKSLSLACLLFGAAQAAAEPITYEAVVRSSLTAVNSQRYTEAQLFMDGRQGILELTVQPVMPACAEGFMCIQVMPEPMTYNLEGATSTVDHCGIITTSAEFDNRPADGYYTRITVRNNRGNTCPTFVALKAMDVEFQRAAYSRLEAKEINETDRFSADDFALIKPVTKEPVFRGQLHGASYQDKQLTLDLSYSGGCREHAFDLKWGECKKVRYMNAVIDECAVEVLHVQGQDDMCKAFIRQKHSIDLSGLAQAYILNLNGKRVLVH